VLIETRGADNDHDTAKLEAILIAAAGDGAAARRSRSTARWRSESQVKAMWQLRENIAGALQREGAVYKYDLSLPTEQFYECVEVMKERFAKHPEVTVCGYGHVGDGNLHLNISAPTYKDEYLRLIEPFVYDYICRNARQHQRRARHWRDEGSLPAALEIAARHRPDATHQGTV
jgi:D-2-hydroxyglutarate dehydrogenase